MIPVLEVQKQLTAMLLCLGRKRGDEVSRMIQSKLLERCLGLDPKSSDGVVLGKRARIDLSSDRFVKTATVIAKAGLTG